MRGGGIRNCFGSDFNYSSGERERERIRSTKYRGGAEALVGRLASELKRDDDDGSLPMNELELYYCLGGRE